MRAVSGAVVLVTFLTSISTCTQTPAPIQLGLNHFWAVLDDTTAEAVENSAVLPEFAHFTVQTVAPGDGRKWTGRYLTGQQTYVELFAVRDIEEPGMPAVVGSVVIGLGTDNIGGLRDLDARLRSSGLQPEMGMQKARIGGRDVDWFNTVNILIGN